MIAIDPTLTPADLSARIARMWDLSAGKILSIEESCGPGQPAPVFTVRGRYTARGWTDWTQGFQFGSALLQFDATGEERFLDVGRRGTIGRMAPHVTHFGVHDHGFNNVSTYGALRRLMLEGRIARDPRELDFYELALKASGAVQAARWSRTIDGGGYVYSFNGPHSLFCDTIRSLRSLALAHQLGHALCGENDDRASLLDRLVQHARTTAQYSVYYGEGRDAYDVRGRVAHESLFNPNDGRYRCPAAQQGYSPFSTWTRGLAWIMLGYAEELEWIATRPDEELGPLGGRAGIEAMMLRAAAAACDFYLENTPTDGVPYWDTGAPGLARLGAYLGRAADPFNDHEPVDSSAAAIACQGLLRLGRYLAGRGEHVAAGLPAEPRRRPEVSPSEGSAADPVSRRGPETRAERGRAERGRAERGRAEQGERYWQAGLTVLRTLLDEPYLSARPDHQGLLLHAVYHRPRGWDYVPEGARVPQGESCLWGDYHLREAALYAGRIARGATYYTFIGPEG